MVEIPKDLVYGELKRECELQRIGNPDCGEIESPTLARKFLSWLLSGSILDEL